MQVLTLKQKTTQNYLDLIANEPVRTIENKKLTIKNFTEFAGGNTTTTIIIITKKSSINSIC